MDLIQKIVETEKDSEKILQEARKKAAQITAGAEAENAARLRQVRGEERETVTAAVKQAEDDARKAEDDAVSEAEEAYRKAAEGSAEFLDGLAEKVAARIIRTVFDEGESL